ncbi:MAG: FAD-dependent oxidoreductase [Planctomycetota bacterium]
MPAALLALGIAACASSPRTEVLDVDVCVYGATAAGIVAALQCQQLHRSVVLIDCDAWLGGMTTAGLGATDVGADAAIGGLAREFYRALRVHYDDDANWTSEPRAKFRGRGHERGSDVAFTFEPKVASAQFERMLGEANVRPIVDCIDRTPASAIKDGARLRSIRTEAGRTIRARVFLDCSYEGDLLATAGCSYVVGRDANQTYGETLNGVAVHQATKHQFAVRVDPYVRPGDASSGLLNGIDGAAPEPDGTGDRRVQAYCYRLCASDDPANRADWPKPANYDERDHELLLRWFDAGNTMAPWHPVPMPNRKTDSNNNGAVSTDAIGLNWGYPEASYEERARIVAAHRDYQQGLMWTLANHPRVPFSVRAEFQRYGLAKDEFVATQNWPPLLYVREARRLLGELVVEEDHCTGLLVEPDPVGLGAYAMDSHNVRRHVIDGVVRNEGDVQVRVPKPYGISYRALLPRRAECDNLLAPVCVSASHIAFGSIRMEPVFMVLAQSAMLAAEIAIARDLAVQDVPYSELRERLLASAQVLQAVAR